MTVLHVDNSVRVRMPSVLELAAFVVFGGALIGLAFVSIYAAAIPFVIGYLALVWLRTDLAVMLMFALAPFCYDLGVGVVKVSLADACLVIATPVLVMRARGRLKRLGTGGVLAAVFLYLAVCVLATLLNGDVVSAIPSMLQMVLYLVLAVGAFAALLEERALFSALQGSVLAGVPLALVKLSSHDLYVLGLHKNSVGASLGFALLASLALWIGAPAGTRRRRWLAVAMIIIASGLLASLSRGAWLGAAAGAMLVLLMFARFGMVLRLGIVLVPTLVLAWATLPDASKEYATDLSPDARNIKARLISLEYANSFFAKSPLLGVGVGLRKQYDATNVVMSTLAETGVLGLAAFALIFVTFGLAVARARLRLRADDPLLPLLAVGAGMVLDKLAHGCVDHFWSRGVLPAWACMGMALFACHRTKRAIAAAGRAR